MKGTVLTFGLISGALSSAMMLLIPPFLDRIGFDQGRGLRLHRHSGVIPGTRRYGAFRGAPRTQSRQ